MRWPLKLLLASLFLSPLPARASLYAAPDAVTLIRGATVASAITLTDAGRIADLDIALTIQAPRDDMLTISLTKQGSGRSVTLASGRGGGGTLFAGTGFSDEAATWIGGASAPFVGTYRPEGLLSVFDGLDLAGVWVLSVRNRAAADGMLLGWTMQAMPATPASPDAVPEPAALTLLTGGVGLALAARRRR